MFNNRKANCPTCAEYCSRHGGAIANVIDIGGASKIEVSNYFCKKCKKHFRSPAYSEMMGFKRGPYTKNLIDEALMIYSPEVTLDESVKRIKILIGISIPPTTLHEWITRYIL